MSEDQNLDPTSNEPATYGSESLFMESLDPKPAPEPEIFTSDVTGLEQAAQERSRTAQERSAVDVLQFKDADGNVHEGDKIASKEFAADEITRYRAQKAAAEQQEIDEALRQLVDDNRGQATTERMAEAIAAQPLEQSNHDIQAELQPENLQAPVSKLAKAFEDPEFRQEFEQSYGQTLTQVEQARLQYANGVRDAGAAAIASLVVQFPELGRVTNEQQLLGAFQAMPQERQQALQNHLSRVGHVITAAQQQAAQAQQNQQAIAAQELSAYKQQQDDLAGKNWAHEPPETVRAMQNEIVRAAEEYGISRQQLRELYENNPAVRHHAFQNMMADAARYRLAQKALARGATRPVPHVQRPGVSTPVRDNSSLAHLQAEFNLNPSGRLAAALIHARRNSR
jgi:hypothetical protein